MKQQLTQQEQIIAEANRFVVDLADEDTQEQQEERTKLPPAIERAIRLNQFYRRAQAWIGFLNLPLALYYFWHLFRPAHTIDTAMWIMIYLMIPTWAITALQYRASRKLMQWEDMRLVGPLVDALFDDYRIITDSRRALQPSLIRLLLRMKASDAAYLSAAQRKRLYSLLKCSEYQPVNNRWKLDNEWSADLQPAILKALEQIGDSQAIPVVEHLAQSAKNEKVRQAAQDCLPFLRDRAEQERNGMLLRPSTACDAQSDTLLRAAEGTPETDPQQLLRAAATEK